MITNDNLLWSKDEYQAVVDYKGNYYSAVNVLLSDNVTMRELNGNEKNKMLPQTKEEFQENLERTTLVYSAIIKKYNIDGCKDYGKTLFRGTRDGKIDSAFLSTSDSLRTAFEFAKAFEVKNKGDGTLLAIETKNLPWIDISSVLPRGDGIEEEPEILFLPSKIDYSQTIDLSECLDIAQNQGERINVARAMLKNFGTLRCNKVVLSELDYSNETTNLSKEELCNMYEEYQRDLKTIRNSEQDTEQYNEAYQRISNFKKTCCTWLHQQFNEINQKIYKQTNNENRNIQVSTEHDTKKVSIGNTGEMYYVKDKADSKEYYFKPALSKDGETRPYRAYIQESAYDTQKIINPENAVKCNVTELNGMFGAIQEKVLIDDEKTKQFGQYFQSDEGELAPEIISQILDEYLVDFCLCNYDSHYRNFIIDQEGKLRGIDKEQSFRYINEDTEKDMLFSTNYNQRYKEEPSIYNKIFNKMKSGEISTEYLNELRYRASRLSQYPDEQYRKIFEQYANGKAKTSEETEKLLDSILDRKKDILPKVEELCEEIYNEWYKNRNSPKVVSTNRNNKTISMKQVVSNAIKTQGIETENIIESDKEEQKRVKIDLRIGGVTKDD